MHGCNSGCKVGWVNYMKNSTKLFQIYGHHFCDACSIAYRFVWPSCDVLVHWLFEIISDVLISSCFAVVNITLANETERTGFPSVSVRSFSCAKDSLLVTERGSHRCCGSASAVRTPPLCMFTYRVCNQVPASTSRNIFPGTQRLNDLKEHHKIMLKSKTLMVNW